MKKEELQRLIVKYEITLGSRRNERNGIFMMVGAARISNQKKYPSASKVLALRKKYPKTVAYLKAKKWSESISSRQALFGARATERILNGEDYEQVIAEMERDELLDSRARDVLERPRSR